MILKLLLGLNLIGEIDTLIISRRIDVYDCVEIDIFFGATNQGPRATVGLTR